MGFMVTTSIEPTRHAASGDSKENMALLSCVYPFQRAFSQDDQVPQSVWDQGVPQDVGCSLLKMRKSRQTGIGHHPETYDLCLNTFSIVRSYDRLHSKPLASRKTKKCHFLEMPFLGSIASQEKSELCEFRRKSRVDAGEAASGSALLTPDCNH